MYGFDPFDHNSIIAYLRQRLADRPRSMTYEQICRKTGLKQSWLIRISNGEAEDTMMSKCCALLKMFKDLDDRTMQQKKAS